MHSFALPAQARPYARPVSTAARGRCRHHHSGAPCSRITLRDLYRGLELSLDLVAAYAYVRRPSPVSRPAADARRSDMRVSRASRAG